MSERKIVTIKRAAELVGCHPHSIRKAEWAKRIPPIRRDELGERAFVVPDDIDLLRAYFRRA